MIQGDQMLSDTLIKLNYGEFSKYHLSPSKIGRAHVYKLIFKDKSIQNGPKVIMVLSVTSSSSTMGSSARTT